MGDHKFDVHAPSLLMPPVGSPVYADGFTDPVGEVLAHDGDTYTYLISREAADHVLVRHRVALSPGYTVEDEPVVVLAPPKGDD